MQYCAQSCVQRHLSSTSMGWSKFYFQYLKIWTLTFIRHQYRLCFSINVTKVSSWEFFLNKCLWVFEKDTVNLLYSIKLWKYFEIRMVYVKRKQAADVFSLDREVFCSWQTSEKDWWRQPAQHIALAFCCALQGRVSTSGLSIILKKGL